MGKPICDVPHGFRNSVTVSLNNRGGTVVLPVYNWKTYSEDVCRNTNRQLMQSFTSLTGRQLLQEGTCLGRLNRRRISPSP